MKLMSFEQMQRDAADRLYMRKVIKENRAALKARAKEAREEKPKKVVR